MKLKTALFLTLFTFQLNAQNNLKELSFSHFTIDNGISQSVINCIHQDSEGFLWFGTQMGLNQFDGYSFKTFTNIPSDTNSLKNNWIYDITEDNNGYLWIATRGGLHQYDKSTGRFKRYSKEDGLFHNIVYGLNIDNQGNIIANTPPAINFINPETGEIRTFKNPINKKQNDGDQKTNLIIQNQTIVWLGSNNGLSAFNTAENTFIYEHELLNFCSNKSITDLFLDRHNNIWIGTEEGLFIYTYDGHIKLFKEYSKSNTGFFIRSISSDNQNNIWIGTEGDGILIVSTNKTTGLPIDVKRIQKKEGVSNSLSNDIVLDIYIDRSEVLWAGTLSGLDKADLKPEKFNLYQKNQTSASINLLDNVLASVLLDKENHLWIGNWGKGLNMINRKTGEIRHFTAESAKPNQISNNFAHVLFQDKNNNLWLGTRNGIDIYSKEADRFTPIYKHFNNKNLQVFNNLRIYKIINDSNGNYWIGTRNGIYILNPNYQLIRHISENSTDVQLSNNLVYDLMEDSEHKIWIATNNGLNVYTPDLNLMKQIFREENKPNTLADNFVVSLCEKNKSEIWIGTNSGLNLYNKENNQYTYFTKKDGISGNIVYEILKDENNDFWFGTGKGLLFYSSNKNKFKLYDLEDGLQSMEFNLNVNYISENGEIFMGGMNGLNSFYPDSIQFNQFLPPIVISQFRVETEKKNFEISTFKKSTIDLNYDENSFQIEFSALDYTNSSKNQYAYKIEELNKDWIQLGNRRSISFTNMSPGDYTLIIKGSNNDEIWNNKGRELKIAIHPPWWKSSVAYIFYLATLIGLTIALIKYREKKLIQEKKILEEKVKERTKEVEKQKVKIERAYNNVKLLSVIGQNITSNLSLEKIIETVYENVNTLMDASVFTIGIYNEASQCIDFPRTIEKNKTLEFYSFSINENKYPAVKCVNQKADIILNSKKEIQEAITSMPRAGEMTESIIYLPLIVANKAVGVISVQSFKENAYKEYQINFLKNIAIYASIALKNAETVIQIENQKEEIESQRDLIEIQRDMATAQRDQIITQKQAITDSIFYAQRIQSAVLPNKETFTNHFQEHFILYIPKDIVSGDFYYLKEEKNLIYFAAADCTGHGVPGAFVSLLGISFLNEIIQKSQTKDAAMVLNELRIKLKHSLHQTGKADESRDGMDISFCIYNKETNSLSYSGAYNPLYILRNNELIVHKAQKMPIGIHKKEKEFTSETINLKKNDMIYLFSDGYIDQFGNENGQKFMRKRFNELLVSIHKKDAQQQKEMLLKTHLDWKGDQNQVDDILIMGIKI